MAQRIYLVNNFLRKIRITGIGMMGRYFDCATPLLIQFMYV